MRFTIENIGGVEHYQNLLTLSMKNLTPYKHADLLVKEMILSLAENERKKGVPFLYPTRAISADFKIKYNEQVELLGDELAYTSGVLDDVDIFGEKKEVEVSTKKTPKQGVESKKEAKGTVTQPENEDILWSTILTATKNQGVELKSTSTNLNLDHTTDLIEFVRNNKNCTVREALQFFTAKEINKQISNGRVFKKNGRLSI